MGMGAGAYAPPGPPGMGGYPAAPAMRPPGPVAPPPVSSFGAQVAPPPPVSAYGQPPAPPPPMGPMGGGYAPPPAAVGGGYGGGGGGAEVPFSPSPWARAAPPAPPQQNVPVPAAAGGPQVAPPAPIAMVPSVPSVPSVMSPQSQPAGGYGAPPMVSFGQPPGGVAPPPMIPGSLGGMGARPGGQGGGIAPPPIISAPPMMSPGSLSGPPPMISSAPAAVGPRVLVGFMVTFQNDSAGSFWPIHSGRTQLGRSAGEGIDIALQDASASSRHASIHADPATGQAFVEDDGSRNGTFLNEARLASGERRQLRDNDRLRLGSTTFVIKLLVS